MVQPRQVADTDREGRTGQAKKKRAKEQAFVTGRLGTIAAASATSTISTVKTMRPPNRSVSMPAGIRANRTKKHGHDDQARPPECPKEQKVCLKMGPNAPISPHIAKHSANDSVLSRRCRVMCLSIGYVEGGPAAMKITAAAVSGEFLFTRSADLQKDVGRTGASALRLCVTKREDRIGLAKPPIHLGFQHRPAL